MDALRLRAGWLRRGPSAPSHPLGERPLPLEGSGAAQGPRGAVHLPLGRTWRMVLP